MFSFFNVQLYRLTYSTRNSSEIREDLEKPRKKSVYEITAVSAGVENMVYTRSSDNLTSPVEIAMTTRNQTPSHHSIATPHKEMSGIKRALFCICGVTSTHERAEADEVNPMPVLSPAEEASQEADSLKEHPLWSKVCDVNAIILIVVAAFVWGFYA
ncbi:unnamed protein product [Ixodes hexagonus]